MFLEHVNNGRAVEPFVLVPAKSGETFSVGEALYLNAGFATKASGTTVPQYICQESAVGEEGKMIHCTLVNSKQELEVPLSASGSSLAIGDKVTIATDGLRVTATTTSGIFTITKINGTATGDTVCGYFLR